MPKKYLWTKRLSLVALTAVSAVVVSACTLQQKSASDTMTNNQETVGPVRDEVTVTLNTQNNSVHIGTAVVKSSANAQATITLDHTASREQLVIKLSKSATEVSTSTASGDVPPVTTTSPTTSTRTTPPAAKVVTIAVSGVNFAFDPSEIKVKKGDKVKIVFTSKGGFHDWVVDEFNARTGRVNDGQTTEVEFTADKVGTFEYYCSVGSHRSLGMVGKLIVE